jgi:hypothetical protein
MYSLSPQIIKSEELVGLYIGVCSVAAPDSLVTRKLDQLVIT